VSAAGAQSPDRPPPPVEARGLVKRYGDVTAVDHVDLNVAAGDVYGYLGPNGAGKTTSLRMLLGLVRADEGSVRLFGRDVQRQGARALDGVAGFVEAPRFYPFLSGRKNLELLAALDGRPATERIPEALEIVELTARARHRVGGYSHGMRQRLGIAGALLRAPRLLLLDEPATGLDPAGMRDMRVLIRRLADDGITVLLSSHQLYEVEEICNRVAIVRNGAVIYEGSLDDLRATASGGYALHTTDDGRALAVLRAQRGVGRCEPTTDGVLFTADGEDGAAEASMALAEAGIGIRALVPQTASLEDLFFRLTEGGRDELASTPAPVAVGADQA
jgi:ABC-2 type transport system ATP-binding protein